MVWYDPRSWLGSSDPQAKVDAAQAKVDAANAELDAAKAELGSVQQGEALSGPSPPAMGGRRRNKKTRRAKKGKSRKASK